MNLNVLQIERQMLDHAAATDRQARMAWMLQDWFPVRLKRHETRGWIMGTVLVALGQQLDTLGWALHPHNAEGG